ncbi:hypothetical protein [Inquilinus sp. CAU 1745]|uniref:hypothetical protein n=1 Tax=Inquilinus sp. CAU 1745 TaxID=3140369 RepID=UPI00325B813E
MRLDIHPLVQDADHFDLAGSGGSIEQQMGADGELEIIGTNRPCGSAVPLAAR